LSQSPETHEHSAARSYLGLVGAVWVALFLISLVGYASPEFRPWENVQSETQWAFRPEVNLKMRAVGDLGHVRGVAELQRPREVVFSTDRYGFRNPDALAAKVPRVVVVGDSYVAGSGLSDEHTVASRLGIALGEPVYNYGLETGYSPVLLLMDMRFQRRPPRLVIYAPVARFTRPLPPRVPGAPPQPNAWASVGEHVKRWVSGSQRDNGLRQLAVRSYQTLRYRLGSRPHVISPEGDPALVLSLSRQGLCVSAESRNVEVVAAGVAALSRAWAQRGTRFVFSPIPESGTIYPDLFPPRERATLARPSFLDRLLARTTELGVTTIDLRPSFRAARDPYLYLRDDSHWNPRGTQVAATRWAEEPALRAAIAPVTSR
jgi:hypothetical protein